MNGEFRQLVKILLSLAVWAIVTVALLWYSMPMWTIAVSSAVIIVVLIAIISG